MTDETGPAPDEPCNRDDCWHVCEPDGHGGFACEIEMRNQDVMVGCQCEHHEAKP